MDRSRSDALTDAETINVENALVRWFALFYESIDEQSSKSNSSSFAQIERDSIHRVAEDNGWTVRKCEILIDIDKDTSTDQLFSRFEAGADLSDNELGRLFREGKIDSSDRAEAMVQGQKTEYLQEG